MRLCLLVSTFLAHGAYADDEVNQVVAIGIEEEPQTGRNRNNFHALSSLMYSTMVAPRTARYNLPRNMGYRRDRIDQDSDFHDHPWGSGRFDRDIGYMGGRDDYSGYGNPYHRQPYGMGMGMGMGYGNRRYSSGADYYSGYGNPYHRQPYGMGMGMGMGYDNRRYSSGADYYERPWGMGYQSRYYDQPGGSMGYRSQFYDQRHRNRYYDQRHRSRYYD